MRKLPILIFLILVACNKEVTNPNVTTSEADQITSISAIVGGDISFTSDDRLTEMGIYWGTSANPGEQGTKISVDVEVGIFITTLIGLNKETSYYFQAFATNSQGINYGEVLSFRTLADSNIFTDSRDGRLYKWVQIGTQIWMAENLAYLPAVSPISQVSSTLPYYYVNNYEGSDVTASKATANYATYGVLYNWPAARPACPSGWHLPTDEEWTILTEYLGGEFAAERKMKYTSGWFIGGNGDNSSGFTALPGGGFDGSGFSAIGSESSFWSATETDTLRAKCRYLLYNTNDVGRTDYSRLAGFSVRCVRGSVLPTVTTNNITENVQASAIGGGNVISDGGSTVTARGVCWSNSQNPTVSDNKTIDGSGSGPFISALTGLTAGRLYYARAYATNTVGTSYGAQVSFITIGGTFKDNRDGHVYKYLTIGNQTWMAENLAYLPSVSPPSSGSDADPYFYVYDYNGSSSSAAKASVNYTTYGVLYNGPAAMIACPTGWVLPTDDQWTILIDFLIFNGFGYGGSGNDIGKSLASSSGWESLFWSKDGAVGKNQDLNNSSGLTALPGGYRLSGGLFFSLGTEAYFWSSTGHYGSYVWGRCLHTNSDGIIRMSYSNDNGFSLRCVKEH